MTLGCDASAARRAMHRRGVGRMRHMQVKTLWVQEMVQKGRLLVAKVATSENVADVGTKPLATA
eukprot:4595112-Prorocentrum_lima.AAC.1